MILQGFADDSGSEGKTGNIFVLAGFLATAEKWEKFSDRWDEICDQSPKTPDFHMAEAYRLKGKYQWRDADQRDVRINELVDLTRKSVGYRVDSTLAWSNYEKAVRGKVPPEIDNPYFLLFYNVILSFASFMDKAQIEGTVDWVFDDQGKVGTQALNWYQFIRDHNPSLANRLGATPIFRHDSQMLPLKAGDIYAWQIRRHLDREQPQRVPHNDHIDPLLGIHGVSNVIKGEHMEEFVRNIKTGFMLMSDAHYFLPLSGTDNQQ